MLQVIDSYLRGLGDALFNSISPFQIDTSTGKYQNAYDSGSETGDVIAILSLLWSIAGGGSLSKAGTPVVAGASGGGAAVAIDGSAVSGLFGASGFSDVEDEIKKLQEGIKESESKKEKSNKATNHGEQRLNERGFSEKTVKDIKENYSQKVYQSEGGTVYAKKNGNYYDVIITNSDGKIITAVGGKTKSLKTWKDVTKMLNNNGGYSSLPID